MFLQNIRIYFRQMRPSSPPATVADMLDNQNAKRNRSFRRVRTNDILQEVETAF